jgi:hypothetical protein
MYERIIDGTLYRGQVLPGAWDVSGWRAGGHHELSARPRIQWQEIGPARAPFSWQEWIDGAESEVQRIEREQEHAAYLEARRLKNLEGNARRAQSACRRFIKAEGFNELLTLTYRENQTDLPRFKRDFKQWVRRMKVALGGQFRYCAGFEPQKRGAWHAHVCCHKLPKHVEHKGAKIPAWRLGTAVWRSIVGQDGGMCFVGGKTCHGAPAAHRLSLAKLAAYVSNYIVKLFAAMPEEKNRYSHSDGLCKGEKYRLTVTGVADVWAMLDLAFECSSADSVVSHIADARGYWLVTEGGSG